MKYSIVIPAYNEEARIENTVRDYADFVSRTWEPGTAEVLVVVNGSRDCTGEIARRLEAELEIVRSWETKARLGKGGAVLQGFDLAEGEILAFTDADNATAPLQLKRLLDAVEAGTDAAIGSRWLPESVQEIPQPFSRRVASRVFNLSVRLLFQMQFKDTQCGAKAFRRRAIEAVRKEIQSHGWAFDVELIWKMQKRGFAVQEVPIVWRDSSQSRIRMHKDGPAMLIELLKLRLRR